MYLSRMISRNSTPLIMVTVLVGLALIIYALSQRTSLTGEPHAFNLAEFGVALDIPASLSNLTYVARDESEKGPGIVLHMVIPNNCVIAALYQIRKDAISESGTTWTKETLEQFSIPQGNNPASVKEFTDFYLIFEPSPTPCASDENEIAVENEKRLVLWNALVTAHYMSQ